MASYTLRINQPTTAQHHHHHHHQYQTTSGNFFNPNNIGAVASSTSPVTAGGDLLAVNTYLERFSGTPMMSYQPDVVMTSDKLGNFYINNNNNTTNNNTLSGVNHNASSYQRTSDSQQQQLHQQSDYFLPYFAGSHPHPHQQQTPPFQQQVQHAQQQQLTEHQQQQQQQAQDCQWPVPYENCAAAAAAAVAAAAANNTLKSFSVTRLIQQHHHHQIDSASTSVANRSAGIGSDLVSHPAGIAVCSGHQQSPTPLPAHGLLPTVRDDSEASSHPSDKSDGKFILQRPLLYNKSSFCLSSFEMLVY